MSPRSALEPQVIAEPVLDRYPEVEGFSKTVRECLDSGVTTLDELSNEFALFPELVQDWVSGQDSPHPLIQKQILAFLEERRRCP